MTTLEKLCSNQRVTKVKRNTYVNYQKLRLKLFLHMHSIYYECSANKGYMKFVIPTIELQTALRLTKIILSPGLIIPVCFTAK